MAEEKDASMDLKSELAELEGLEGNLDNTTDISADLVEMKNRMDKSDQEMRAMTEAMKSTLLDVRTLMQDMDNPFNMLRDMGVDKLVTKAVETVEEEVNQKKNEEAKNKMAGVEEDGSQAPVVTKIEGSTTNHPGVVSSRPAPASAPVAPAPAPAQPVQAPAPTQAQPAVAAASAPASLPVAAPTDAIQTASQPTVPIAGNGGGAAVTSGPSGAVNASGGQVQQLMVKPETEEEQVTPVSQAQVTSAAPVVSQAPATPVTTAPVVSPSPANPIPAAPTIVAEASPQYSHIEERIYQTEETVNNLASTMGELIKTIRTQRTPTFVRERAYHPSGSSEDSGFYEAYVGLVADYMYIRLGDRGAEELLLEGMYKEWASPKVVRDIMDKLSGKKRRRGKSVTEEANVEDRMLITTLLRNLDKPTREWSDSTHLFMLMALVSRAKETMA